MRITFLFESTDVLWGGVKMALEAADRLQERGHQVLVVSKTPAPTWMDLQSPFLQMASWDTERIPESDVVVGTFWTTVPVAVACGRGVPVHFCQGYEGASLQDPTTLHLVEQVYRLDTCKITIAEHLADRMRRQFAQPAIVVPYAIDHAVHYPGPEREANPPVRIGLVGPYEVDWKDIPTGLRACELARAAGLELELVRISNTGKHPDERALTLPMEFHDRVPPAAMGELYRSLDLFLGSSRGDEEGFFLPAVEAMASGVPSVLTDIPCFRGYGDGSGDEYAMFVEPRNPDAMAQAILQCIHNPSVRGELRAAGLAIADRYRMEHFVTALEAAFERCVAERRPPTGELDAADSRGVTLRLEQLATEHLDRNELGAAARHLRAALCLNPDDPRTLRMSATTHALAGAWQAALADFDRLAELGYRDSELALGQGQSQLALGQHEAAVQSFQEAVESGLRSAELANGLGVALFHQGRFTEAVDTLREALEEEPDNPTLRANLSAAESRLQPIAGG